MLLFIAYYYYYNYKLNKLKRDVLISCIKIKVYAHYGLRLYF